MYFASVLALNTAHTALGTFELGPCNKKKRFATCLVLRYRWTSDTLFDRKTKRFARTPRATTIGQPVSWGPSVAAYPSLHSHSPPGLRGADCCGGHRGRLRGFMPGSVRAMEAQGEGGGGRGGHAADDVGGPMSGPRARPRVVLGVCRRERQGVVLGGGGGWTARTMRGGAGHLGLMHTETQRGRLQTACGQRRVDGKNSQTTPATTSTTPNTPTIERR